MRPSGAIAAAIENHETIRARLDMAADRLHGIMNRLFGEAPPTPTGGVSAPAATANSQLGELSRLHDSVNYHFERLYAAIDRAESL